MLRTQHFLISRRGTVTSANNGGFASVRCKNLSPPMDLGAYEGVEVVVKGNGQRYKLVLRTEPGWDTVGYSKYVFSAIYFSVWQRYGSRLAFEEVDASIHAVL